MEEPTPPPPTRSQYFLKTRPISKDTPSVCTPLYLRLRGDGVASVVLTPASPKFLRWHDELDKPGSDSSSVSKTRRLIAISWRHPDRTFGLVVPQPRESYAWENVTILENEASHNLAWEEVTVEGEKFEILTVKEKEEEIVGERAGGEEGYKGWIACQWVHGHAQLFWANGALYKELPPFFERIYVVREWLIPRE
jgi:hypothetical protein